MGQGKLLKTSVSDPADSAYRTNPTGGIGEAATTERVVTFRMGAGAPRERVDDAPI